MQYTLYKTTDNAEGQLDAIIGASALNIILESGQGALFPQPRSSTTGSAGTTTTLNKVGIGATGIAVGDFIENVTDGSQAYVLQVLTDSLVTSELQNGSDNTWQNGDTYRTNSFIGTINKRNADGIITAFEKVKIIGRTADSLTVDPSGRGFDGTAAQAFAQDDYFNLFVTSREDEEQKKALADICRQIDLKASILYVQAALASRNWKDPVVVATTTAGTLASSFENGDTVDGIVLVTGNRILIKNQVDQKENGIYTVNASGAPTRATDFDSDAELTSAVVAIIKGTSNADTVWICVSDNPTLGVSNIVFTQNSAAITKASLSDAQAASDDTKYMTPLRVLDSAKYNRLQVYGGDGSDGNLVVSGTITLNLNKVYNYQDVSGTGTLTFTGSGSIALLNIAGNLSGNFTIELRNTSSGDPSVTYMVSQGGILSGGNTPVTAAPNTGGTGGGNGGSTSYGAGGGNGGTSTSAGAGTAGIAGVAGAQGGDGGGGGSAGGGGGGGGGGANATNSGTAGSAASGNQGGAGGAGATGGSNNTGGRGGGGGGGFNTGNGGAGGSAGGSSQWNNSASMPNDNTVLSGGKGGASGANGGTGGAGGNGGGFTNSSAGGGGVTYKAGNGGDGGWGYSGGGNGGAGGTFTHSASGGITAMYGANGGAGGHSTFGTGGTGGAAGTFNLTSTTGYNPTYGVGGRGGDGRTGGAGGAGASITGSNIASKAGTGGRGGDAKTGVCALYIAIRGNSSYTGTINGQGGAGGAGGAGGNAQPLGTNGDGGAGGNGVKGADIVIFSIGTMAAMTINNLGGAGGTGGATGTGGVNAGVAGANGTTGANGVKIAQRLII